MKQLFMLLALATGSVPLAAQDTTPPTIVSLSYLPASADVTVNPQTIAFTMHVTDDISGADFISATFTSPSQAQTQHAFLHLSVGTALDGTFTGNATIPKFAESGTWTLKVIIGDKAGNTTLLTTAVLAAAGFPTTLPVTSNEDITAPTVTNISFSSPSLDVSAGPQTLTLTLTLTDSPAGVNSAGFTLTFQSPSGLQHKYSAAADFTLTGGTIYSGTWQAAITFPQYSEAGIWTIGSLALADVAGNHRTLSTATLTGLTSTFTMIDTNPDTMPPAITSFDFSPKLIDTSAAAQNVTVTVNITDDLSGVDFSPDTLYFTLLHGVRFTSPSHGQSVFCCAFSPPAWNLTGGTALSGTWQATLRFPQFSEQGTWKDAVSFIKDQVQNTLSLTTAQVAALGFPTDLVVVKPSLASDGTVGPGGGAVADSTFGARAEIIFPPGMVSTTTTVAIDVFSSPLDIPNPHGFSGPGTLFVDINLTPIPSFPLPAPGVTLVLPVSPAAIPGTSLSLFSVDPILGTLVPVLSTSGTPVVGTVDASGLSATFLNVSHLSIFVGLIPLGGYDNLTSLVNQYETKLGVAADMVATLQAAQTAAANGNAKLADNQLNSLIHQVSAQSGKSLTAAQAALLIQLATALII